MAQVSIRCPSCKATLKVDGARSAGRRLKCPKCEKGFKVPARGAKGASGGSSRARQSAGASKGGSGNAPDEFDDGLFDSFDVGLGSSGLPNRTLPPPRRKKNKPAAKAAPKQEEAAPTAPAPKNTKPALIVGGALLGFAVLAGLAYMFGGAFHPSGSAQATVEVPQEFESYRNRDAGFGCQYPAGWTAEGGGGTGGRDAWARFEKGDVTINIRHSSMGTSIGDISGATSGGTQEDLPDELKPIAKVHEFRKSFAEADMADYEEKPPEVIETGMGEGRISEFTASEMFFGRLYGYRATLLSTNLQLNVICKCRSEAEWKALKPTFRKVIQSIQ